MEKIKVGKIINTHGIKGEIKVQASGNETFDRDISYYIGSDFFEEGLAQRIFFHSEYHELFSAAADTHLSAAVFQCGRRKRLRLRGGGDSRVRADGHAGRENSKALQHDNGVGKVHRPCRGQADPCGDSLEHGFPLPTDGRDVRALRR